jgi:hypothetical protein
LSSPGPPVPRALPAPEPNAMFLEPVVFEMSASNPTAVLSLPVVFEKRGPEPIPVLLLPVLHDLGIAPPFPRGTAVAVRLANSGLARCRVSTG